MSNFLATYLLHSTVLLAAIWLLMRVARPRSPVLVERLWKLAAVLPVMTALAAFFWPISNNSETHVTLIWNDVIEISEDELTDDAVRATAVSAVPVADADDSFARLTEPWHAIEQSLDVPTTNDLAAIDSPAEESARGRVYEFQNSPSKAWEVWPSVAANSEIRTPDPGVPDPAELVIETDASSPSASEVESAAHRAESWLRPAWQLTSTLLSIWAVIGAVWLVIRSAWFRWRLRHARHLTRGRAVDLLRELNVAVTRPVRLLIVPGFAEPAAFGVWRPTIVLPPSCESLDREALRAVLAHELGHIVRGDVWWLAIGRVLTTLLGFQPLNRVARREWTRAAECLCDDWAVSRGVERLTLARCLTALAEHRITGVSLADALAALGSPSSLRSRVERLVAEPEIDPWSRRSRRWMASGSVLAIGFSVALLLPLPEVLTASVPRPSGSGLAEDHAPHELLPDGRGTEVDAEIVSDIETELSGLRTELQHAARLAEQSNDPFWIDVAESLREREQRIVERWQRWKSD